MDNLTPEQRKKVMRSIRSQSKLENKVTKALWHKGLRFRKNADLYGKPDIAIQKYKAVVFIDSCFWHNCPRHGHIPTTNEDYWTKKLGRNMKRDLDVTRYYKEEGWCVLRMWEHEFKENFDEAIEKIIKFIDSAKQKAG
ncbi:very short patch repair endonuclease [Domibacillus sp.]|uniref:very short patch repair endonuclease n=1 Tax=Domibacillus sp. TaxID=1969783 RepID=UPI0028126A81|nr:very short patch repair endonuclease [Domibacillus sp.]